MHKNAHKYKKNLGSEKPRMLFVLLINVKMPTIVGILTFMSNCWHFNIYEQAKFHAQMS